MPRPARRLLPALVVALAAAFALSGCGLASAAFTFHPGDTVDGSITIAVTKDAAAKAGVDIAALRARIAQEAAAGAFGPARAHVSHHDDGELHGSTISFTRAPFGTVTKASRGLLTFERVGEEIVVTGAFDPKRATASVLAELGLASGAGSIPVTMSFRFPGAITSHEGVSVEGPLAIWRPPPGQPSRMTITAAAKPAQVTWGWLAGGIVLGAALTVGIVAVVLHRSRPIRGGDS